jgi:hypothetical protein
MCSNEICCCSHQLRKCREVNSGPLSQRIDRGLPRWLITHSNTRVTRRLDKQLSTSMARHSRVKPSSSVSARNPRPLAKLSITKSMAHS